jgi:hypothetical protein
MLHSDLVASLPSRILDPAVLPARVNLLLQKADSVSQPVRPHSFERFILLVKAVM